MRIGCKQKDVELVLEIFFRLEGDGWHNKKCDEVLDEYRGYIGQKSEAGKKSAAAKKQRSSNTRSTSVQPNHLTNEPSNQVKKKNSRFAPPSHDELLDYVNEKSLLINVGTFIDFYESKGWMVGKNKMKDWKAAARNWSKREESNEKDKRTTTGRSESNHARVMRKIQDDLAQ